MRLLLFLLIAGCASAPEPCCTVHCRFAGENTACTVAGGPACRGDGGYQPFSEEKKK